MMASTFTAPENTLGTASVEDISSEHISKHSAVAPVTPWVGARRALPAIGFIGVCAAAAFTELSAEEGQVLCPYRLITGGWCPGCGCTRALKALVRGEVRESIAMNPWTLVIFVQALIASVALLVLPERTISWIRQHRVGVGIFNIVFGVAVWVARLGTGVIPLPFT